MRTSTLTRPQPKTFPQARFSGWVGDNSARLDIRESEDQAIIDGWVGSARVDLREADDHISGSISDWDSYHNVSLWIYGEEGSQDFQGFIGNASVNLSERTNEDGSLRVSGWMGSRHVNLTYSNEDGQMRMRGDTGDFVRDRISLRGEQTPVQPDVHYEGIIPALAFTRRQRR